MAIRYTESNRTRYNIDTMFDHTGDIESVTEFSQISGKDSVDITADGMTLHKDHPTTLNLASVRSSYEWRDITYYYTSAPIIPRRTVSESLGVDVVIPTYAEYNDFVIEKDQKAISNFWDKVSDTDLNLAITLGEINQTTRMVRKSLKLLKSIKKNAIKTIIKSGKPGSKSFSKAWLTYIYGITPLLNDVYNLSKFEAREIGESVKIKTGSGGTYSGIDILEGNGSNGVDTDATRTINSAIKYGRTYGAELSIPTGDNINRLTTLDPLQIAWELTPFSFVFDWFIDVGGSLRNLEASRRYASSLSDIYTTQFTRRTDSQVIVRPYSASLAYQYTTNGERLATDIIRTPLTSIPSSGFPVVALPNLGYKRVLSAVALIRQVFL